IGKGSFGSVGAVRVKKSVTNYSGRIPGAQMAIKIFSKSNIRDDVPVSPTNANRERRNLAMLEWHPFITGMYTCIQDSKNLYQLMELGHLGSLRKLIKERGPLPTSVCQFYFANLVLALEFLHGNDLIHCDLKPDNIVIGANGYLMLCDFGNSGFREEERDWNLVGTTMYASPEALVELVDEEIAESVDWWAAGCILFEMATGRAVNLANDNATKELEKRVIKCQWWWPRSLDVDPVLRDLVERMLNKDFEKRLGCVVPLPEQDKGPLKNKKIRAHRFLRKFPWKGMERRSLAAPFVPTQVPDASEEEWDSIPLPQQKDVPGLTIVKPVSRAH
ncbi:kinase-like domain-containing protein, partial [Irpex rosettiformis]